MGSFGNVTVNWQAELIANGPRFVVGVLESVLVVALVLIVGRRLERSWRNGRLARTTDVNLGILIGRLTYIAAIALGIIWVAYIFGLQLTGLLTFLGALSLAVTFALQDLVKNLVAGLYLLWERPFMIGDSITVKDSTGVVQDILLRTTLLRADEGQLIVVPNAVLFSEIVINRRQPPAGQPEAAAPRPTTPKGRRLSR